MKLKELRNIIKEEIKSLDESSKIDKLVNYQTDMITITQNSASAELGIEQLEDGEDSIYISEIWSDVKGKGDATKLLNTIKKYSDRNDIPISLRASVSNNIKSDGGLSQKELVNWYIKQGFKIGEEYNNFPRDSKAPFMVYNVY